ncbi:hypothetical protein ACO2Q3_02725 [Caulobacter sp. KR2-114]|uniref:hypothetical protein n=1 Tax=Caulobacter sp. KR2-114 TaxID=3400912 RepID=UPI003BFB487E
MTEAQRVRAEGLRGWFELQLRLAEVAAERRGAPLGETVGLLTNLHRRFGLGTLDPQAVSPFWRRYVEGLEARATLEERLDWTVRCCAEGPPPTTARPVFGCFAYDPPDAALGDGVVRIHFENRDDDGVSPLADDKLGRRRADAAAMFGHIAAAHADAHTVKGGSWLYNLEAYRRLFPPQYGASRQRPEPLRLNGTSSWGQLIDHRGQVKPAAREAFLTRLRDLDPDAPWRVFPLPALAVSAPLAAFTAFYGERIGD